ncbi:P-loop containing nucleoside triphosphate hydrolase protein [Xylaria nigripes]|nr:P-loop containing nucleoside triphosphate hydrolase protein [Xylaria nigripes]
MDSLSARRAYNSTFKSVSGLLLMAGSSSMLSSKMKEVVEQSIALDGVVLEELNSSTASTLLDTINSLRELQVSEMVDLPQIVVVGRPIIGFPTRGDVCTRSATELVIYRAPETRTDAVYIMTIRPGYVRGFSLEALRVEVAGPSIIPSLTLVDLPGFFHSETDEPMREEKEIYQNDTIILAVVSASYRLANQIVLEKTRRHDPNREHETKFIQLARDQESVHNLNFGWHVLRNRPEGKEQTSTDERDAEEEIFFQSDAGILLEKIQRTLPILIKEIEASLSSRQHALEICEGVLPRVRGYTVLRRLKRAFYVTLVTKGVGGHNSPEYLESYLALFRGFPEPITISEENLHQELEQLAAANQGVKFPGLPNGNLGFQLFRVQARPWRGITKFYLDQVINFTRCFVEDIFVHVIGANIKTADVTLVGYVEPFFEKKRKMLEDKLQEILRPYAESYGPALDEEFYNSLWLTTSGREATRIASLLEDQVERTFGNATRVTYLPGPKIISLGKFAQNVVNLVAENCLISDLHTILAPSMILAFECEDIRKKRKSLQCDIDR